MYFLSLIWTQIVNFHDWLQSGFQRTPERRVQPDLRQTEYGDDEWVSGWDRQQRRLHEALTAWKQGNAPTKRVDESDEWVEGWDRQQQRLKDALTAAKEYDERTNLR